MKPFDFIGFDARWLSTTYCTLPCSFGLDVTLSSILLSPLVSSAIGNTLTLEAFVESLTYPFILHPQTQCN